MQKSIQKILEVAITIVLLGGMIYFRTMQNYTKQNYHSSNFFVFWLSGRLLINGKSPYIADDWHNGHEQFGGEQREPIFLYPLPLAPFMIPLGLLTVDQGYFVWQILSQILIAIVIYLLLNQWLTSAHRRLLIPIMLFMMFFGPVYLTLQIGSIGPITFFILFMVMTLLQRDRSFAAGIVLALTLLKPPQALTILLLIGAWFLARRDWKAIFGIMIGGIILWGIGASLDLNWVGKFLHSSQSAFDRRLGIQPNILSFSYVLCNKNSPCTYALGGLCVLILLSATAYYLWRRHANLTIWETFNLIIPIGFTATVYLWGYDQMLYILPIVWIVGTLVERTKSYIYAFIFLIMLDIYSFFALFQQAITKKDLWSLGNTVIVFGVMLGLLYLNWKKPKDQQILSAPNMG